MKNLKIVVVGTVACDGYAGMAWMIMQLTAGLRRLGHDARYFETTSTWPYDPVRESRVCDADYAVPYLARVAQHFGLAEHWAYRRSWSDKGWMGPDAARAEEILASADLVFNIAGATRFEEEHLKTGRLVYFGTDPVFHEIYYAAGDTDTISIIDEHDAVVTYGENIGNPECPIPPLPRLQARTRQPVLMDMWRGATPRRKTYTTVANWKQGGRDVQFNGETYHWSKHHEFLKFIDVPARSGRPIEVATNLQASPNAQHGRGTAVPAYGFRDDEYGLFTSRGWRFVDGPSFTTDPSKYRDYVTSSRGEFSVARDLNVRLRSGWFSERSACYLAAGRPVITQDTGFGCALPVGEGLFAFSTTEQALAAFEAVEADYERHSRAAREIAQDYFAAERVLPRLLADLGV